jgi:L-fuconolactonase
VTGSMTVIDAHVHLGPPKYASREDFAQAIGTEEIEGAVLVQHLGNTDNRYLARTRTNHADRFAALAIVERASDVAAVLVEGFAGLRLGPHGLPGTDGAAVFDALDPHRAVISVTGPLAEVASAQFRATVRSHPKLQFRIEHVGGFRYGRSTADREQFARLLRLSEEANVTLMWSGYFVNANSEFPYVNTHADLLETLAAFGSTRIMWSGDWNRAGLGADDYRQAAELVGRVVPDPGQQADILGLTARRVFGLTMRNDTSATHV